MGFELKKEKKKRETQGLAGWRRGEVFFSSFFFIFFFFLLARIDRCFWKFSFPQLNFIWFFHLQFTSHLPVSSIQSYHSAFSNFLLFKRMKKNFKHVKKTQKIFRLSFSFALSLSPPSSPRAHAHALSGFRPHLSGGGCQNKKIWYSEMTDGWCDWSKSWSLSLSPLIKRNGEKGKEKELSQSCENRGKRVEVVWCGVWEGLWRQ